MTIGRGWSSRVQQRCTAQAMTTQRCDRRNRKGERGPYSGWFLLKFRRIDGSGWSRRVLQQVGAAMAGLYPLGALKGEIIDKTSARTGLAKWGQNGGRVWHTKRWGAGKARATGYCSDDGGNSEARQAFRRRLRAKMVGVEAGQMMKYAGLAAHPRLTRLFQIAILASASDCISHLSAGSKRKHL